VGLSWSHARVEQASRVFNETSDHKQLGLTTEEPFSAEGDAGSAILSACAATCAIDVLGSVEATGDLDLDLAPGPSPGPDAARKQESGIVNVSALVRTGAGQGFQVPVSDGAGPGISMATIRVAGECTIVIWGAHVALQMGDASYDATTGRTETQTAPPLDVVHTVRVRALVIRAEGLSIALPAGWHGDLDARSAGLALDGTLAAARADGRVASGGETREVRASVVSITGRITVGTSLDLPGAGPASVDAGRNRVRSASEGQATSIKIDGVAWGGAAKSSLPAPATIVAGSAGILLIALLVKLGGSALYSRIGRHELLDHPNRRALLDHIQSNPGEHVASLSRATSIGRVVLQHHLRMLESHGLVVTRNAGRLRRYFPAGETPSPEASRREVALRDPTRRAVLDAIDRAASPLTQRDLQERVGISQRLASYHLAKLETMGLVQGEGSNPRRYQSASPVELGVSA
jgi:DNA-binding transcriptional ArsR family regulator